MHKHQLHNELKQKQKQQKKSKKQALANIL